eukprot:765612-Hanusia_phi.AAC.3
MIGDLDGRQLTKSGRGWGAGEDPERGVDCTGMKKGGNVGDDGVLGEFLLAERIGGDNIGQAAGIFLINTKYLPFYSENFINIPKILKSTATPGKTLVLSKAARHESCRE